MLGDYLCEFVAIVRHGAIAPAALELGFSQSALSRHLAALETTLGCKLIERAPGGIHLTEDGRYVYDVALEITRLGDALKERLAAKDQFPRALRIAVAGVTDAPNVSAAFDRACLELGGQGFEAWYACMAPCAPQSLTGALWDEGVDLVVVPGVQEDLPADELRGLECVELGTVPLVAVVEKNHPLCKKGTATMADVRGYLLGRAATRNHNLDAIWCAFARMCEARGFTPACHTSTGGDVPGFDDCCPRTVLTCVAGSFYAEHLRARGYVEMPLVDVELTLTAVVRAADEAALRFAACTQSNWPHN